MRRTLVAHTDYIYTPTPPIHNPWNNLHPPCYGHMFIISIFQYIIRTKVMISTIWFIWTNLPEVIYLLLCVTYLYVIK
jgi:hypothetical protein